MTAYSTLYFGFPKSQEVAAQQRTEHKAITTAQKNQASTERLTVGTNCSEAISK